MTADMWPKEQLPPNVQILAPSSYAVLPPTFSRHAFHDSLLDLRVNSSPHFPSSPAPFVAHHPDFLTLLGSSPSVRVLARGAHGFAHEAGVYVEATDEVWFTSNLRKNGSKDAAGLDECSVQISTVRLSDGRVTDVDVAAVLSGNGACAYEDKIIFCDQGSGTAPSQLVLVDPTQPHLATPVLNNYRGRQFNSLNDVATLSSPSGQCVIWFTDPPYGSEQAFRPCPALPPHVYAFNPSTGDVRVVADGFAHPNGICFSPGGETCYITDTSHIHGTGALDPSLQSTIYAFDVVWRGDRPSLRNRRLFAFADTGVPDGIKCDTQGNVFAGCGDGIHVWDPHGTLLGRIVLGLADGSQAGCANFCFVPGGRLVCFAENKIYLVEGLRYEGAAEVVRGVKKEERV